jgi:hypothetical protein
MISITRELCFQAKLQMQARLPMKAKPDNSPTTLYDLIDS